MQDLSALKSPAWIGRNHQALLPAEELLVVDGSGKESFFFVGITPDKLSSICQMMTPTPTWIQAVLVELILLKSREKQK